jgi:hypothetical protein
MADMGRPTGYDPEFCDRAVAFLADGFSIAALAGELSVARSSVYKWIDEHPEFSDAVKIGQAKATLWWERANRTLAITGQGNATACVFGLKNRSPEDWRDVKATEVTGKDGGPVEVNRIEIVAHGDDSEG